MPGTVTFYKDGDHLAVSTNITEEREFIYECAQAIDLMIAKGKFLSIVNPNNGDLEAPPQIATDWAFQLEQWLANIVDIACKLRGYKSDVQQIQLLVAGALYPDESRKVIDTAEENESRRMDRATLAHEVSTSGR